MIPANTLQLMMSVALSQIQNDRSLKESELIAETERLRIMADVAKYNSQKEIIQSLISLSQHVFDRKLDFFVQTYNSMFALITQHQSELLKQLDDLRGKEFDENVTENKFIQIMQARSVINSELNELKKASALMSNEFNHQVASLKIELNLPRQNQLSDSNLI